MKAIYTLLILLIPFIGFSQNGINFQGAASDSDGNKIVNQNISLRTSVMQGGPEGLTSYSETHNTNTDKFGLFNVVIGLGDVISGNFDSIQWGANTHFLKVELDANGGTDYNLVSTTQMMSVPYAKYADNAGLDTSFLDNLINSKIENFSNNSFDFFYFGQSNNYNPNITWSSWSTQDISFSDTIFTNNEDFMIFAYTTQTGGCGYNCSGGSSLSFEILNNTEDNTEINWHQNYGNLEDVDTGYMQIQLDNEDFIVFKVTADITINQNNGWSSGTGYSFNIVRLK